MPDKTVMVCFGLFCIGSTSFAEYNSKNLIRTEKYTPYFFLFVNLTFKVWHSIFLLLHLSVMLNVFKINKLTLEKASLIAHFEHILLNIQLISVQCLFRTLDMPMCVTLP